MKYILFYTTFFLLCIGKSYGQEITYYGEVSDYDSNGGLSGATIKVYSGGLEVSSVDSKNGKYTVKFAPGKTYKVEYSKPGYVSKFITVDVTKVNEEDLPPGGKIFAPINLDLFTERGGADFSFLKTEAVASWFFDKDKMNFDQKEASQMKKKVNDRLKEAESTRGQLDANYNALIEEADKLFDKKEYDQSLVKYTAALKIPGKGAEMHPNKRIVEIGDLLQNKAEEKLGFDQDNQAYLNLIGAADNFAKSKNYDKAIAKYKEASELKKDEQYPKDKILEMQEEKENASKREEYNQLVSRADGFLKQNSLRAARDTYTKASKLLPKEEYPKEQLKVIDEKLEAQAEIIAKKEKYNKAIEDADAFFDKGTFDKAIEKYREASFLESASTYPKDRIKIAEGKILEQEAENKKLNDFNLLVEEGNKNFEEKKYETAVEKYNAALKLFDQDDIKTKRDNVQKLLTELKEDAEKNEQIAQLLATAQKKMESKDYSGAIDDFSAVLKIDNENLVANVGKEEAEKKQTEKENFEELTKVFNELVAKADQNFKDKNWEESQKNYLSAKEIFEDKKHVNDRIVEVQSIIDKEKKQESIAQEIQELLTQAENLKKDNQWEEVIQKYEAAQQLDNQRDDIKKLLVEANKSKKTWEENQSKEEQFSQLKKEGNSFMDEEKWTDAKLKFEEALKINNDNEIVSKLKEITEKIKEEALFQDKAKEYQSKMEKAENLFSREEYKQALNIFKEASEIEIENNIAQERIDETQKKIDELSELKGKNERYAEAMEQGQKALTKKDYPNAIKYFDDALIEKAEDVEATKLRNLAQSEIKELESVEEKYEALLKDAQSILAEAKENKNDISTLEKAKEKFVEAQKIRPEASIPQNKIIEINELLKSAEKENQQQVELQKIDKQYQEQLDLALEAEELSKFDNAIEFMKKASKIKPDETFPKEKIKEYQTQIENLSSQKELDSQYQSHIAKADQYFEDKEYKSALTSFQAALKVKEGDTYAQKKTDEIEQILKDLQKQKEENQQAEIQKIDKQYQEQLDLALEAEELSKFDNAIEFMKNALKVKPDETFPKEKIKEYQTQIENLSSQKELDSQYQSHIAKANHYFEDKEYESALTSFQAALKVKEDDTYAQDKVDETEQILKNIQKQKDENQAQEKNFELLVEKADALFKNKEYTDAVKEYEKALKIKSNDSYTIKQVQLCLVKIKEMGEELKYQNILTEADQNFNDENYEEAIMLYKEALQLKKREVYPKNRIAEIENIQSEKVKKNSNVEYLGVNANISILEGAALLEQGERERENLKLQSVEEQLRKNEGIADDLILSDYQERFNYENEINTIKNKRAKISIEEQNKHRKYIQQVSDEAESIERLKRQLDGFQDGKLNRNYKNVVYIQQENEDSKRNLNNHNRDIIDKVNDIEKTKESLDIAESANHNVTVVATYEEVVKTLKKNENLPISNKDRQIEIGEEIIDIEKVQELNAIQNDNDSYEKVMKLNNEVVDIENQNTEKQEDKLVLHQELQDDVYNLEKSIQRKREKETEQNYLEQLQIDNQYTAAQKQYEKGQNKKDDSQQLIVQQLSGQIKGIDTEIDNQISNKSKQQYQETQKIEDEVQTLQDFQSEQAIKQDKDLATVNENLKSHTNDLDKIHNAKRESEKEHAENMIQNLDDIAKQEELIYKEKDDSQQLIVQQLSGQIKGIDTEIDKQISNKSKQQYQETQKIEDEVQALQDFQSEQAIKQDKDLATVNENLKSHTNDLDKIHNTKREIKKEQTLNTIQKLDDIVKQEELTHEEKGLSPTQNYENVKEHKADMENQESDKELLLKDKKIKTQELITKLESNALTYSPIIANTIGDEYPEGVSQESFIRKDNKGIPVKIVTRRFVVKEGRGDIYIRIQSRSGLTYSKNGMPITEGSWIKGTENANLEKHF